MVTWYGYSCDCCGEWFIRWSKYFKHANECFAKEQEKFLRCAAIAYRCGYEQAQEIVRYFGAISW